MRLHIALGASTEMFGHNAPAECALLRNAVSFHENRCSWLWNGRKISPGNVVAASMLLPDMNGVAIRFRSYGEEVFVLKVALS